MLLLHTVSECLWSRLIPCFWPVLSNLFILSYLGGSHLEGRKKEKKELGLKELNPQDKKRVANLVKELAKVGEERQFAEERIKEERVAFEERLAILQEEYDAVIKEKACIQLISLNVASL